MIYKNSITILLLFILNNKREMSKIPKKALTSNYYKALYENILQRQNEPHAKYLFSLYKRCLKLSREGKPVEAEELLKSGRAIVRRKEKERIEEENRLQRAVEEEERERLEEARKRAISERRKIMRRLFIRTHGVAPVRRAKTNKRHNLRSNRVQRRIIENVPETLNEYILQYVEKIKHKKESLISFLKKMYEMGYVYRENTKKWARVRN